MIKDVLDFALQLGVICAFIFVAVFASQCAAERAHGASVGFGAQFLGELTDGVEVFAKDGCTFVVSKVMGGHAASVSCR